MNKMKWLFAMMCVVAMFAMTGCEVADGANKANKGAETNGSDIEKMSDKVAGLYGEGHFGTYETVAKFTFNADGKLSMFFGLGDMPFTMIEADFAKRRAVYKMDNTPSMGAMGSIAGPVKLPIFANEYWGFEFSDDWKTFTIILAKTDSILWEDKAPDLLDGEIKAKPAK